MAVWSLLYVLFLFFQWQCMYEYRPSAPNQLVDLYRRRTTRIYNYKYIFYIWTDSWLFLSLSVVRSFRFHTLSLNLNVVLGCLPVFCLFFFFYNLLFSFIRLRTDKLTHWLKYITHTVFCIQHNHSLRKTEQSTWTFCWSCKSHF